MNKRFYIINETPWEATVVLGVSKNPKEEGNIKIYYPFDPINKTLFTLVKTSQDLFDKASIFAEKDNFPEKAINSNFKDKDLKKLKNKEYEDLVNKVCYSVSYNIQKTTINITDAMMGNQSTLKMLKNIVGTLFKALSFKKTLAILDRKNMAPKALTEKNYQLAKDLSEAFRILADAIPEIIKEIAPAAADTTKKEGNLETVDNEASEEEKAGFLIRQLIKIINNISDLLKTITENFEAVVEAYEKEHVVESVIESSEEIKISTEDSETSEEEEVENKIPEIKALIEKINKNISAINNDLSELSEKHRELEGCLNIAHTTQKRTKENAETLYNMLEQLMEKHRKDEDLLANCKKLVPKKLNPTQKNFQKLQKEVISWITKQYSDVGNQQEELNERLVENKGLLKRATKALDQEKLKQHAQKQVIVESSTESEIVNEQPEKTETKPRFLSKDWWKQLWQKIKTFFVEKFGRSENPLIEKEPKIKKPFIRKHKIGKKVGSTNPFAKGASFKRESFSDPRKVGENGEVAKDKKEEENLEIKR